MYWYNMKQEVGMAAASEYPESERSRLQRIPERGSRERAAVHAILDEGMICHVGLATDRGPVVIPTIYARVGDRLYLHGSPASRMLRDLSKGVPVCVTVTHVDALVLARSAFHHSMNYRSAVIFGTATEVKDREEKQRALAAVVEHVIPGRSEATRPPNDFEFRYTRVVAVDIEEATAKVRTGPPNDDEEDLGLPHWAGLIPVQLRFGTPEPAENLAAGIAAPEHAVAYRRPGA
jgi:nitroimidazol reductase NimA-like FMN-containing flavoprotein (pyridoxamine 5'-phosphate oxidase superfamily)